jgi:hypothetical protein
MSDTQSIETTTGATEHEHQGDERQLITPTRRAAAIEAAYILEAVRK